LIESILAYSGYFLLSENGIMEKISIMIPVIRIPFITQIMDQTNVSSALASTVFFAIIIAAQIGNVYACRTNRSHVHKQGWFANKYILLGVVFEIIALGILVYVEPFNTWIGSLPIPFILWPLIFLATPILYTLEWAKFNAPDKEKYFGEMI
jgi:magnesium-transporting ATPase (P-type)